MTYENLRIERRDGVALVVVDRPARLNALDARTLDELDSAFVTLAADPEVRGVRRGLDRPLSEAQEDEAKLFGELAATEDAHEGTRAFLEKRAPQFRGR